MKGGERERKREKKYKKFLIEKHHKTYERHRMKRKKVTQKGEKEKKKTSTIERTNRVKVTVRIVQNTTTKNKL